MITNCRLTKAIKHHYTNNKCLGLLTDSRSIINYTMIKHTHTYNTHPPPTHTHPTHTNTPPIYSNIKMYQY